MLLKVCIRNLVSNDPTVFEENKFENRVPFGLGQIMTLTIDTHLSS